MTINVLCAITQFNDEITYKGKSAIALKCGAGPCNPNNAKIALHIVLTQYLGITKPGITYIDIERA